MATTIDDLPPGWSLYPAPSASLSSSQALLHLISHACIMIFLSLSLSPFVSLNVSSRFFCKCFHETKVNASDSLTWTSHSHRQVSNVKDLSRLYHAEHLSQSRTTLSSSIWILLLTTVTRIVVEKRFLPGGVCDWRKCQNNLTSAIYAGQAGSSDNMLSQQVDQQE